MSHDATVPDVAAAEAAAWLGENPTFILDVREAREYSQSRIPGALSIPQSDLALRMEEVPQNQDALVVCSSGRRSVRAARFLKAVDYDRATNLAVGTDGWKEAGNPVEMGT